MFLVIFQVGARALILSPTRELALQTLKFTKDVSTAFLECINYILKNDLRMNLDVLLRFPLISLAVLLDSRRPSSLVGIG